MRELMLENAGGEWNSSQAASRMLPVDKELIGPGQPIHYHREGRKCKDWAGSGRGRNSDQAELAANLLKGSECLVEVTAGMGSGDLAADPRLTLRNHGIAEASDEHAFSQEEVAHTDRGRGLAQDDRYYRCLAGKRLEAEAKKLVAEISRVFPQLGHPLRMGLQVFDTRHRAGRYRGWECVAEELRPSALGQVIAYRG